MLRFDAFSSSLAAFAALAAALFTMPAAADPAISGVEKVSKREVYTASDADAFVVFRFTESVRYVGSPVLIWAKADIQGQSVTPYAKKSLDGIDFGHALTAGSLLSLRKKKPKYYAFRIPAGPHLVCEFYLTPANSAAYVSHTAKFAAPYFEFQPGTVNYIGHISVAAKSIITMPKADTDSSTIFIEDTDIPYLQIGVGGEIEEAAAYVKDRFDGVRAEIVRLSPIYLNLHKTNDGSDGFEEVKVPSEVTRESEEFVTLSGRARGFNPECLPSAN